MLGSVTPLSFDCGELCGKLCCRGDETQGMILFPGEKEYIIKNSEPFLVLHKHKFRQKKSTWDEFVDFGVCNGECPRSMRPLSCRIYPYTPYISAIYSSQKNKIRLKVIEDPRSRYTCPLTARFMRGVPVPKIELSFRRSVKEAFAVLCQDKEFYDFCFSYSRMLDSYRKFM